MQHQLCDISEHISSVMVDATSTAVVEILGWFWGTTNWKEMDTWYCGIRFQYSSNNSSNFGDPGWGST